MFKNQKNRGTKLIKILRKREKIFSIFQKLLQNSLLDIWFFTHNAQKTEYVIFSFWKKKIKK